MADQTVADTVDKNELRQVEDALRHTAQAVAILRAVWLAVEAQEDGCVRYEDNKFSRWGWSVDAACSRVRLVRDLVANGAGALEQIDWWTPLNLMEAMGAALWHSGIGTNLRRLEADQLQSCADAAIDGLELMYTGLSTEASRLSGGAA